ncbi:MAG: hypothetical protein HDT11_00920 [Helicobacter sp.]|nr:hypothetical protein [Helicobacter sp.]
MLINTNAANQNFTFGQALANRGNTQDSVFALPLGQQAVNETVFILPETMDLSIPQNTIKLRENFGVLEKIKNAEQAPKILGFPIDEEGYLTATFNNAAGIPESFKIHGDTILGMMRDGRVQLSSSEELVGYFKTTYARLQEMMGEKLYTTTGFFTQEQLDSMPHAFVTRDGSVGGEIQKIYTQEDVANSIYEIRYGDGRRYYNDPKSYYGVLDLEPKAHYIVPYENGSNQSGWSSEKYLDENGNLSQGGLLSFAVWEGSMYVNQKPDFYTQSYYDIEEGKMTMEEYVRQYAKGDFLPKEYQWGHREHAKRSIAMASWIQDKGFSEKDLNEMTGEDFKNLEYSFIDLTYAYNRMKEEEEYSKRRHIVFDPEAFLLQLFATDEVDSKNLDVPDLLLEEVERKRQLEDENYQPKKKEQETLAQKVINAGAIFEKIEQLVKTWEEETDV